MTHESHMDNGRVVEGPPPEGWKCPLCEATGTGAYQDHFVDEHLPDDNGDTPNE